jgi:hypothetical protein
MRRAGAGPFLGDRQKELLVSFIETVWPVSPSINKARYAVSDVNGDLSCRLESGRLPTFCVVRRQAIRLMASFGLVKIYLRRQRIIELKSISNAETRNDDTADINNGNCPRLPVDFYDRDSIGRYPLSD